MIGESDAFFPSQAHPTTWQGLVDWQVKARGIEYSSLVAPSLPQERPIEESKRIAESVAVRVTTSGCFIVIWLRQEAFQNIIPFLSTISE